nr:MAG TPA: hypothetical protein [Caudoviricetes sp.]
MSPRYVMLVHVERPAFLLVRIGGALCVSCRGRSR